MDQGALWATREAVGGFCYAICVRVAVGDWYVRVGERWLTWQRCDEMRLSGLYVCLSGRESVQSQHESQGLASRITHARRPPVVRTVVTGAQFEV